MKQDRLLPNVAVLTRIHIHTLGNKAAEIEHRNAGTARTFAAESAGQEIPENRGAKLWCGPINLPRVSSRKHEQLGIIRFLNCSGDVVSKPALEPAAAPAGKDALTVKEHKL